MAGYGFGATINTEYDRGIRALTRQEPVQQQTAFQTVWADEEPTAAAPGIQDCIRPARRAAFAAARLRPHQPSQRADWQQVLENRQSHAPAKGAKNQSWICREEAQQPQRR